MSESIGTIENAPKKKKTLKHTIVLKIPLDRYNRMETVMKKERMSNKTAFILDAVDAACTEQEKIAETERIENALSILANNARIDREQAAKRHTELMVWLDTLADAVLSGDEDDIREFKSIVHQKLNQRRGTNQQ